MGAHEHAEIGLRVASTVRAVWGSGEVDAIGVPFLVAWRALPPSAGSPAHWALGHWSPDVGRRAARHDPRLTALAEESGYEILGGIGAGGMGIVYRAHDADGNDVAIKLLRHEISDDPRARERLAREVAAQKLVRNDNIVRILDAELESSDAFVVTDFVPGPTLEDAVRVNGGLHPEAVREIGLVIGRDPACHPPFRGDPSRSQTRQRHAAQCHPRPISRDSIPTATGWIR